MKSRMFVCAALTILAAIGVASADEVFTAKMVRTKGLSKQSVHLDLRITEYATQEDADALQKILAEEGQEAMQKALRAGDRGVARVTGGLPRKVNWVRVYPGHNGSTVIIVTEHPLYFPGEEAGNRTFRGAWFHHVGDERSRPWARATRRSDGDPRDGRQRAQDRGGATSGDRNGRRSAGAVSWGQTRTRLPPVELVVLVGGLDLPFLTEYLDLAWSGRFRQAPPALHCGDLQPVRARRLVLSLQLYIPLAIAVHFHANNGAFLSCHVPPLWLKRST